MQDTWSVNEAIEMVCLIEGALERNQFEINISVSHPNAPNHR
jgi:hypothetical protein